EQRRAARAAARPGPPGLLPKAAGHGTTIRGAVRGDGSQVRLLLVFDVTTGTVRAQREADARTNEIPELAPPYRTWTALARGSPRMPAHAGGNRPSPGRGQARPLPDDHRACFTLVLLSVMACQTAQPGRVRPGYAGLCGVPG